jgi:L-amino acid N-acyltransferase YncA
MFELPLYFASRHARQGLRRCSASSSRRSAPRRDLGCVRLRSAAVPFAVAAYITAAYWFTASTSFANPAVTLARAASDTFAGVRPVDVPGFIVAQLLGAAAATGLFPLARAGLAWFRARCGNFRAMTTDGLRTRLATPADAPAIAAIYNEGIADRIATFETEPRTPEQLQAQLIDKGNRFPTVVVSEMAGSWPGRAQALSQSSRVLRRGRALGVRRPRGSRHRAGRVALEAFCRAMPSEGSGRSSSRIFPENTASLILHGAVWVSGRRRVSASRQARGQGAIA